MASSPALFKKTNAPKLALQMICQIQSSIAVVCVTDNCPVGVFIVVSRVYRVSCLSIMLDKQVEKLGEKGVGQS